MMSKAKGSKPNWFAIGISVAVVVVLVGAGVLVVMMNNMASSGGTAPEAGNVNQETGAISFGDGEDVVATYIDFMCPACNNFEQVYGDTLDGLVEDGTITLDIHPIAILDSRSQGAAYSTRAANAMYCVAEHSPDRAMQFLRTMFKNQPQEGTEGLSDDEIISIAEGAGASGISECVTNQEYKSFVTAKTTLLPGQGTPTVVINGEVVQLTGVPEIDIVQRVG